MKRTLAILLCILLLIPVLAVCASANEVYTFEYGYVEALGDSAIYYPGTLPAGSYIVKITKGNTSIISKEPVNVQYQDFEIDDGYWYPTFMCDVIFVEFPAEYEFPLIVTQIDGITLFAAESPAPGSIVTFESCASDTPALPSVSDTLDICIDWVGTVTTSLLSGELNGLLLLAAIPIAISLVLLTAKIIKKNSWGC